jgi:hypothetical protein
MYLLSIIACLKSISARSRFMRVVVSIVSFFSEGQLIAIASGLNQSKDLSLPKMGNPE